ncbi:diguanylate cyclase domain-containing protein [Paenibacillus chibensis]|uniref:diguanylate cyclase domain-containing protein n=1 Tax=Paenibacillus chibensis TaxID=59846 RepID=UPI000FD934CB|nr:diguanylate cyclase [Paenibacillus chibensis]MEC0370999.1 diguanylate cyclase [Paenibacillus chibensis]
MKNPSTIRRLELGYVLLIALTMVQELLIFLKIYLDQSYTTLDAAFSMALLAALLIGFIIPMGISVVVVFVYMVSYFVWLTTYAPLNVLTFSWMLLVPANLLIAAFIKSGLIGSKRWMERMNEMKGILPQVDIDTSLGNKEALEETVQKQSNLAKRYADRYGFSMAMFKIDFLPLVQESLGSQLYSRLLLELSATIQKQIRYEDYKFAISKGRFIILCPMLGQENLHMLTSRIKNALMNMVFLDKRGQELKLVIRAGALVFQKEQFGKYEHIDEVIAALERNTETDLIGEYI